ncbi:MAG: DUF1367 family protein [Bacteroidales bacterium]|nr:DUF1367 family protein [Bacteroidales bacterium]
MKYIAYKSGTKIFIDESMLEDFLKLENGFYYIELKRQRNILHHRKFFAILKIWAEYKGIDLSSALVVLKILLGEVETVEYMGKKIVIPKSISFESMDEVEFTEFYNKAILFLATDMGLTKEELEMNIED